MDNEKLLQEIAKAIEEDKEFKETIEKLLRGYQAYKNQKENCK
jgi:hypothetical protein